ncbi:FCD domain-containing protein, partial [Paraglaciecola sp.]|uniref:FCD domain-containing protein n=1 Tax=Paraglaciecola sp. TaxID=1920173 RepID=UPI003EF21F12
VEMHSLTQLLNLSTDDPIWGELNDLLSKHVEIRADIENRYMEFPDLDRAMHMLILRAANNRFTSQFFDIISFICHYHYQWDKSGELERFTVAMDEHIDLLKNLLARNSVGVIASMQAHLSTAESTLLSCVEDIK